MTDEEVSEAAALVLAAIHEGRDEDHDPSVARRRLEAELGQRLGGWRYCERAGCKGVQQLFGEPPQSHNRNCMPHADHSGFYEHKGHVMALVEQPYLRQGERPNTWEEICDWCDEHGVVCVLPEFPSWWYPGWTSLVLIMRPETLAAGLEGRAA